MAENPSKDGAVKAVALLINMGGPENPGEVRSFIYHLFNDSHVIGWPQPLRFLLAFLMATIRTPVAIRHYNAIGGGSPLKKWTRLQAEKTARLLHDKHPNLAVLPAYSYCEPTIRSAVSQAIAQGAKKIIAVPLYPHYSFSTLGSVYAELEKARTEFNLDSRLVIAETFHDDPCYITATANMVRNALHEIDENLPYQVIFSAHALPQSQINKGDPYRRQLERTVSLVAAELQIKQYVLSFQSKIGPVEWMKPSTVETVRSAGRQGVKQVVIVPIGFVCDHIETLYELDIELAGIAKDAGIEKFVRAPVFNDYDLFINLLASLIEETIR